MMDSKLFVPANEYDLEKISEYYQQWIGFAEYEKNRGLISKAIDICILVLNEIDRRFTEDEYYASYDDYCPIDNTCLDAADVLPAIMSSPYTKPTIKAYALRKLKEVAHHTSFTGFGYFDIDEFIRNERIYSEEWY